MKSGVIHHIMYHIKEIQKDAVFLRHLISPVMV